MLEEDFIIKILNMGSIKKQLCGVTDSQNSNEARKYRNLKWWSKNVRYHKGHKSAKEEQNKKDRTTWYTEGESLSQT